MVKKSSSKTRKGSQETESQENTSNSSRASLAEIKAFLRKRGDFKPGGGGVSAVMLPESPRPLKPEDQDDDEK